MVGGGGLGEGLVEHLLGDDQLVVAEELGVAEHRQDGLAVGGDAGADLDPGGDRGLAARPRPPHRGKLGLGALLGIHQQAPDELLVGDAGGGEGGGEAALRGDVGVDVHLEDIRLQVLVEAHVDPDVVARAGCPPGVKGHFADADGGLLGDGGGDHARGVLVDEGLGAPLGVEVDDAGQVGREGGEVDLGDGEDGRLVVLGEEGDVQLAPGDELLDEGGLAKALVDGADGLGEGLAGLAHDGGGGNALAGVGTGWLDDPRRREGDLARGVAREDQQGLGDDHAGGLHQGLAEPLVEGQGEPRGGAAGAFAAQAVADGGDHGHVAMVAKQGLDQVEDDPLGAEGHHGGQLVEAADAGDPARHAQLAEGGLDRLDLLQHADVRRLPLGAGARHVVQDQHALLLELRHGPPAGPRCGRCPQAVRGRTCPRRSRSSASPNASGAARAAD